MHKLAVMRFAKGASPFFKAYAFLRLVSCPFEVIERYVPAAGNILDLGCGYGLLDIFLWMRAPGRRIRGLDCRQERVEAFSRMIPGNSPLTARAADIRAMEWDGGYDCCILSDVLYQLTDSEAAEVIDGCRRCLLPGGLLLVKETDAGAGIKTAWILFQETVIARLLGLNRRGVRLFSREKLVSLMQDRGFACTEIIGAGKGYPYPHTLYVCRKNPAA